MGKQHEEKRTAERAAHVVPTRVTLLYESRDGRLCLFEDAKGHLYAVPASRLA